MERMSPDVAWSSDLAAGLGECLLKAEAAAGSIRLYYLDE
jgi:hypothetical protein